MPLRIMSLGGSITYGVGSSDGNGYRKHLLETLQANNYGVHMVGSRHNGTMSDNGHEGWRGFRVDQIKTKAKGTVEKWLPNVCIINAGSNDCLQDYDLENLGNRVGDMLEYLWLASPGSTLILSSLLTNLDKAINVRIHAVNKQLYDLARLKAAEQRSIVFVDMCGAGGPCIADLVVDGTHPNDTGYRKMAGIWFHGIQEAAQRGLLKEPLPRV